MIDELEDDLGQWVLPPVLSGTKELRYKKIFEDEMR